MNSTLGRPRTLTDAQVKAIMDWYYGPRSLAKFARHMNLSVFVIEYCIHIRGRYKQPSPELRQQNLSQRQSQMQRLHGDGWL